MHAVITKCLLIITRFADEETEAQRLHNLPGLQS